jgi:hypothetical protein
MGLRARFVPDSPIEELAEDDHQLKLSTNEQLRKARADEPAKQLPRSREAVTAEARRFPSRFSFLRRDHFLQSGPGSFGPAQTFLRDRVPGILCVGYAGAARLGGSVGARGTAVERLDLYVLRILSWLGAFAGTFALL